MVVEVQQNASCARLQIVSVDGLQEVIKGLFSKRFNRVPIVRRGEHEVKVSVRQRLQQLKT